MSGLCFVCLTRDAGAQLVDDVFAAARTGDQIVIVDDSGRQNALAEIRLRQLQGDVPFGVTVTPIVIGAPTTRDIAVQLGLRAATTPRAIVLVGQMRIPDGFHAARDMPATGVTTGPDLTPDLFGMIFPPRIGAATIIETLWAASTLPHIRAKAPLTRNAPSTQDGILSALGTLQSAHPDAQDWVAAHRDAWASRCTPGARIVHAIHTPKSAFPAPLTGGAKPRVFLAGPHANRCPLNYPALAPLWEGEIGFATTPKDADLVIFTHPKDVEDAGPELAKAQANFALFSEEPFWDSLFSPDPCAETVTLPMAHFGMRPMRQINHHTSEVYNFDFIPYYVLTHPRFIAAYQRLFDRNAKVSAADWKTQFAARDTFAAYMAERRTETFHDLEIPQGGITGLCAWRTRLAEATRGNVQRLGASWQGGRSRFQIGDWHRDKLAQLDGQSKLISAIENTHQPTYISEKFFDAYACAARPIYVGEAHHLVHKLGLPALSWVNLAGQTSTAAAQTLADLKWSDGFYAAFAEAQKTLCALFHDEGKVAAEQRRLQSEVISEIKRSAQG